MMETLIVNILIIFPEMNVLYRNNWNMNYTQFTAKNVPVRVASNIHIHTGEGRQASAPPPSPSVGLLSSCSPFPEGRMHWDDLHLKHQYNAKEAYCQSKLANVLFTRELARKLQGTVCMYILPRHTQIKVVAPCR